MDSRADWFRHSGSQSRVGIPGRTHHLGHGRNEIHPGAMHSSKNDQIGCVRSNLPPPGRVGSFLVKVRSVHLLQCGFELRPAENGPSQCWGGGDKIEKTLKIINTD